MRTKVDLQKQGTAQAAVLSAMLGILALSLVNLGTVVSKEFESMVHNMGKLWMPGAEGIGPYSGKETILLAVWLLSWFLLQRILREREWNPQWVTTLFLAGMAVATTLLWPPVTHWAVHFFTQA